MSKSMYMLHIRHSLHSFPDLFTASPEVALPRFVLLSLFLLRACCVCLCACFILLYTRYVSLCTRVSQRVILCLCTCCMQHVLHAVLCNSWCSATVGALQQLVLCNCSCPARITLAVFKHVSHSLCLNTYHTAPCMHAK